MTNRGPLIEVEPHVFVFQGAGVFNVNSLILEDDDGLTLIDTQLEDENNHALLAAIRQTWPKTPLHRVLISHYHLDHYLGLAFVREAFGEVEILGPPNAQPAMAASTAIIWESYLEHAREHCLTPNDIIAPTHEMPQTFSLSCAGRVLDCRLTGPNEAWATMTGFWPDSGTLFASDVYFGGIYIDPRIGGTVLGWYREARRLLELPCIQVICGHGTRLHHRDELEHFVEDFKKFLDEAQFLVANGCDLARFVAHSFTSALVIFGREFSLTNIYHELESLNQTA